jgi:hypothetical protein
VCAWRSVDRDPRHTPTTTFETFPFPWPPGSELPDDPRVAAFSEAARKLDQLRTKVSDAEILERLLALNLSRPPA